MMSLSRRQLAVIAFMAVCGLAAAIVCLFAPLRVGLLAVLVVVGACTAITLLFLRKVLRAVYGLRDNVDRVGASSGANNALQRELGDVVSRLDSIELHLPERLAARVAFELARRDKESPES